MTEMGERCMSVGVTALTRTCRRKIIVTFRVVWTGAESESMEMNCRRRYFYTAVFCDDVDPCVPILVLSVPTRVYGKKIYIQQHDDLFPV